MRDYLQFYVYAFKYFLVTFEVTMFQLSVMSFYLPMIKLMLWLGRPDGADEAFGRAMSIACHLDDKRNDLANKMREILDNE